jgi:hypothetical protein
MTKPGPRLSDTALDPQPEDLMAMGPKRILAATVVGLAAVGALAGCGSAAPSNTPPVPVSPASAVTSTTAPPATTTVPPTTTTMPTPTTSVAPVAKSRPTTTSPVITKRSPATRAAPKYGYQCRAGDEKKYAICAGHDDWVNGQQKFADCQAGGGTWDVEQQMCVHNK